MRTKQIVNEGSIEIDNEQRLNVGACLDPCRLVLFCFSRESLLLLLLDPVGKLPAATTTEHTQSTRWIAAPSIK